MAARKPRRGKHAFRPQERPGPKKEGGRAIARDPLGAYVILLNLFEQRINRGRLDIVGELRIPEATGRPKVVGVRQRCRTRTLVSPHGLDRFRRLKARELLSLVTEHLR